MRILINAATIVVGGGIQVTVNFIENTLNKEDEYFYVISKNVNEQLLQDIPEEKKKVIDISPASIIRGYKTKKEILKLEKEFNPDIVYSIGAPSYIKFKNKEVQRLTNPWVIGPNKHAVSVYSLFAKIKMLAKSRLQRFYIRKNNFIITQTNEAKNKINKNLKIPLESIYVIPNVYSKIFDQYINKNIEKHTGTEKIKIFCLSAPYPHKNISIIPKLVKEIELLKPNLDFEFIVTLPENDFLNKFNKELSELGVINRVKNIGKLKLVDLPEVYNQSNVLFLPTLLEVYSVTYLESMRMGVPIVTTNFSFSQEVCQEAALYFEPFDYKKAAINIINVIIDDELRELLISNGREIIKKSKSQEYIYNKHIEVLKKIVLNEGN
ncbi:glycosyltransferase [uncultured Tenacibaculum sp.]|uniref:glycosyltransferase n=1 Tax=uncultured Tenacibaculum sp. TaxID=174713 RepID=UPI00263069CA|nr:glycosyltransferase [uncultured Tenacibaculum sp.]